SAGQGGARPLTAPPPGGWYLRSMGPSEPTKPDESRLTPEMIERFRRIGLRLDTAGRVWHQGEEVAHAGLRRAILRWLDVLEDGRTIVRLDERRYAYIDVDDAHLRIVSLRWEGDAPVVVLDDGSEEPLACDRLWTGPDGATFARVRGDRLIARFTTQAQ